MSTTGRRRRLRNVAIYAATGTLVASLVSTIPSSADPTDASTDSPPASDFFSTASVESSASEGAPAVGDNVNHGDLWPNCWAGDNEVYTAYGDGVGFGGGELTDIGVAKISGEPGELEGTQLANDVSQVWNKDHNRKPTGMACVDGTLYLAVQDLALDFNAAPSATIAKSTDQGKTWEWDTEAPMFDDGAFTTVMFLDYGKDYGNAPDDYVYAYGLDNNWRDSFDDRVPDPTGLNLARMPRESVMDRSTWEFASGFDGEGNPTWSGDIEARSPVMTDDRHIYQDVFTEDRVENTTVLGQGGVVYNKPLDRYIYTSWTEYTYEFYEAPNPWGPWKHFNTKDFGGYPWTQDKHGGYGTTIPSKYISEDGKSMWMQSNVCPCGGGYPPDDHSAYTFSLRQLGLEPYQESSPSNKPDPERNLAQEEGTVGVERATHHGNEGFYNDGELAQSEDDWNDERKGDSWWGYTWPQSYTMDKVAYTTGEMAEDGGWFAKDLRVQVRKDHEWVDVKGIDISPAYPYDNSAGANETYTLSFDAIEGDGVRIIGAPGGDKTFTSIAELEAYYAG